MLGIF